jgi:hypothetical protein
MSSTCSALRRTAAVAAVAAAAALVAVAVPSAVSADSSVPPKRAAVPNLKPSARTAFAPVKRSGGRRLARAAYYAANSWITGNCNGNSLQQTGTWDATAMIGSTLNGGDTYRFAFHLYDRARGVYVVRSDWTAGDWVRQAPSLTWIPNFGAPVFFIPRQRWYAVYVEVWSNTLSRVVAKGFVPMQRIGADLTAVDGTYYCMSL